MRSNLSAAAVLILLAVCFMLGLASALLGQSPPPRPTPPSESPPTVPAQTTVLIVGVDDLQVDHPALMALWVAAYRQGADMFVLGVPLDFPAGQTGLSGLFAFSRDEGVSPAFLQAFAEIVPVTPDLVVVVDRTAFIALVDYLGGLELNGAHLDGVEVAAALDLLGADASALLTAQGRVLEAMAARASLLGSSPDITPLISLVPGHVHLSQSLAYAIGLTASLLPVDPMRIHFDRLDSPQAGSAGSP